MIERILGSWRGRTALVAVLAVAATVVVALAIAGRGGSTPNRIVVSDTSCAPGWSAPRSGRSVFTVANTSKHTIYGVDLVGGDQVSVYGEIEMLAPGTSDTIDAVLPPGRYSFDCESFRGGELSSQPELIGGPPVANAHPYAPVTSDDLRLRIVAYRKSLQPVVASLVRDTDALTHAVDAGRLASARKLWLTAHLDYERLGVVYDTLGGLDPLINGRPLGLPRGVHDPNWHGFLRLEYALWHSQPAAEVAQVANLLDANVHQLRRQLPHLPTENTDLPLRTHEILENALQFELTGETDEGSHTNLATAWANVQGTQLALAAVAPLLAVGSPRLAASARTGLTRLAATLAAYRHADGTWTPVASLSRTQREHLDAETSGLLETLELVPDKLELPRTPSTDTDRERD